jgi:phosphopantetheine--protein transferase-like protein
MVLGIGIDLVEIKELKRLVEDVGEAFVVKTFTERERKASEKAKNPSEYLASRFAVKEAVFKALAPLTEEKTFDFRKVETLCNEDGSPYIHLTPALKKMAEEAGVKNLLVSLTHEGDYAGAFVIAESEKKNQ